MELRWAWRGVRARGWRGALVVGLVAVALAANATMFSVADSLLLNTRPYPDADRIIRLSHKAGAGERIGRTQSARLHAEWRRQTDIFSGVSGYLQKNLFLTGSGHDELTETADVTVDFLKVLAVRPRWGREFVDADLDDPAGFPVVISEALARRRFGRPELAVGQTLETTAGPHVVVGVMPAEFAFPRVGFDVWRAIVVDGPLTRNFGGVPIMARLAPRVTAEQLPVLLAERSAVVGAAAGLSEYTATADSFVRVVPPTVRRTLLLTLLGAAFCLLMAACANVASLELALAMRRERTAAVHLALGARPASLARVAALEGLLLIGGALAVGLGLAWAGIEALHRVLPDSLRLATGNPLNLDGRAVGFALSVSLVAWLLAALPPVLAALRFDLSTILRSEDRAAASSRGGVTMRRALTVGQVAVAVALTVGGLLYVRSYQELLSVDKGFDSSGLAVASMNAPATFFPSMSSQSEFTERLLDTLRAVPGVVGVTSSSPPPHLGDSPTETTLEVDGRAVQAPVMLGQKWVDTAYFGVVGLRLLAGRHLEPSDPPANVVVSEAFARRFWPDQNAVGHSFTGTGNSPYAHGGPYRVVGVVSDFRSSRTQMPDPSETRLFMYSLWSQLPQRAVEPAGGEPQIDTGGSFRVISATVRVDSRDRAAAVAAAVSELEPRLRLTFTWVDDLYARQNSETLLASQVVGAFSVLAFVVSVAGVYGVMAFLVAGRRREIGIRLALGAEPGRISRMVLGSSAMLVVWGVSIGSTGALVASRWVESQLFGVSPADPAVHVGVAVTVAAAALLATWHPARQASRVDPAVTLRAE